MSHWWRAYDHSVDNAKLQRLPGDLFKAWYNLCCLASANEGTLPSLTDVSFKLRVSETKARNIIETLQRANLIDERDELFQMHDWNEYQYKSDVSTERVKRFRERNRNDGATENETAHETVSSCSKKRSRSVSSSFLTSTATPLESKEDSEEQACGKFAEFWNIYPHKVGKKDAEKAFDRALKSADFATLMSGLAVYAAKTDDRPWCNPATWLNQGRWDDQPAPQVKSDATTAKPDGIMEHLAKHTERLLSRGDYTVSSDPNWLLPDRRSERS